MERKCHRPREKIPEGYTLEPPDGGHAWAVLAGVFFAGIVTVTVIDSLPVIFKDLIYLFDTNAATISWLPAIVVCGGQLSGPFATMFIHIYGYRRSVVLGGFLCASGMIFSYFARRVSILLLIYSITGPGVQLCLTSYNVILSQYFKKYFTISMGVFNASIGASRLFMTPLTQIVSMEYGCRAVFLIIGANVLHVCIMAAIFQPAEKHLKLVPVGASETKQIDETSYLTSEDKEKDHDVTSLRMTSDKIRPKSINMSSSWDIFGSMDLANIQRLPKHSLETDENDGTSRDHFCLQRGVCSTIDHSLWWEPAFYLICVNNLLMLTLMIFAPFYLYPLGLELGLTPVETAGVVMAKSLADVTGKLVGPVVITMMGLSCRWTYIILALMHSLLLALIIVADTFNTFMCVGIVSGFVFGIISALVGVLLVDCLGVHRFASAIGLSAFVQAFFILPIPPFMGWIRDTSGNYLNVYLLLALLQLIVSVIWIPQPLLPKTSSHTDSVKSRKMAPQ